MRCQTQTHVADSQSLLTWLHEVCVAGPAGFLSVCVLLGNNIPSWLDKVCLEPCKTNELDRYVAVTQTVLIWLLTRLMCWSMDC